ncbi:MAG: hypothetical protein JWP66_376 [Naasia sp.]|nr:hypothetical protein [Naasia sp.]
MTRRSVLARCAVGLAVFLGVSAVSVTAASATDECSGLLGAVSCVVDPMTGVTIPTPTPTPAAPAPAPVEPAPPVVETPPAQPAAPAPAAPAPAASAPEGAPPPPESAPTKPETAPVSPAAPAPQSNPQTGGQPPAANPPAGASAPATSAKSPSSSAPRTSAPAALAPETAVPLAPAGPVLTSVEATAATTAIREVRETLPASVQPNTRLLAEETSSQGIAVPSPNDDGLLALIVAMGAASVGCAIAAFALRPRRTPRHTA